MKYFKRKLVSENIAVRRFEVEENKLISLTVEGNIDLYVLNYGSEFRCPKSIL